MNEYYMEAINAMRKAIKIKPGGIVGVVIVLRDGSFVYGFNIENMCHKGYHAEETATISAVIKGYKGSDFKELIMAYDGMRGDGDFPIYPMCGHCRQMLWEYGNPELKITLINSAGEVKYEGLLKEVYPFPYPTRGMMA